MLGRENESIHRIWTKKIPKMFITLVVFSLGYYVFDCYTNTGIVFLWKEFAIKLYLYNLKYHLWYLYLYIAYSESFFIFTLKKLQLYNFIIKLL